MRVFRYTAAALAVGLLMLPLSAYAAPAVKHRPEVGAVVGITRQGQAYCFDRAIAAGGILVAGGRCYTFYLLRTAQGGFLGFGPPGPPMIPPGQLVRLSTPAGAKLKGRLFYLIPLLRPGGSGVMTPANIPQIPIGTLRYTEVIVNLLGGRVVITLPRGTADSDKDLELPFDQR